MVKIGQTSISKWIGILFLVVTLLLIQTTTGHANPKYASLVVDANNGVILHQSSANRFRYPASLTKLMTLYLTFDALEAGRLRLNQRIPVSARAAAQPAMKLGLKKGDRISVRDAVMSLIVRSSNDAAVVLAEAVAGSEWQFAMRMTKRARDLGMRNTTFRNASGLHHFKQRTTAYDLARLAIALRRDHAKYYNLFANTHFSWKGKRYRGHNRITNNYPGADGLKTGYISASGYNLISSVSRGDEKIVAVVMGGKTSKSRDAHMTKLLDRSFKKLARMKNSDRRIDVAINHPKPSFKPYDAEFNYDKLAALHNTHKKAAKPLSMANAPKPTKPQLNIQVKTQSASFRRAPKIASSYPTPTHKPLSIRLSSRM